MAGSSDAPQRSPGLSGGSSAPQSELRWRRAFPGEEDQLAELRRWLESMLPDCQERGDVASVATELGANAVRHTASGRGGVFVVELTWHRHVVRIAVADGGAPTGPRMIDDPFGESGRGLLVVRGMSVRTGVCGDHRGRLVWADIPWSAGAAEPVRARHEAAVGDGEAVLASRFGGAPAWFGRSTLRWWALAGGRLVSAASAADLAKLLGDADGATPLRCSATDHWGYAGAGAARGAGGPGRAGGAVPGSRPAGGDRSRGGGLGTAGAGRCRRVWRFARDCWGVCWASASGGRAGQQPGAGCRQRLLTGKG